MHHNRYFIAGSEFEAPPLAPGLYVVATPIGNLRDISLRALEILAAADAIYCEDTRVSAKLCAHYGVATPRRALHDHNERAIAGGIVAELAAGKRLALISDAGTPLLSDPGFALVRAARAAELPIFAAPGASALLAALAVSGLATDAFSFFGFLPAKSAARKKALAALAARRETLVFYESPRRLGAALAEMAATFGPARPGVVALELTKKFERVAQAPLAELAARFSAPEKGEAVVLVAGAEDSVPAADDWLAALDIALAAQPLRGAVDAIAERYGVKRKEVYDAALRRKAQP